MQTFDEKDRIKILVCGGRNYDNYESVKSVLDQIDTAKEIICVIHGCATGADSLADKWALENGKLRMLFPADWEKDGKAAGPIRNSKMLKESLPDLVVAFPGGTGTADMIKKVKTFNEKQSQKEIKILQFVSGD